ncbi:unnamed protein product [Tilletia controversa]|uniref:Uncharacterized protein n=4 Tax=Tilletia TaxID=13289 RepID=A0A8X7SXH2_9BASI|nr:hypothetical protein CF336_g1353 [Tilletia laevis]KAE8248394.1 hypothetical protein A4X06_0g3745 [Tilletia controversa]KAE8264268.1 hypothetical protein A4X03_0g1072 [Tilletia caries]KAE8207772.1 hypothetical protein CF335_g906 [Tilletia laevis]CAD6945088.1 unnamed protein product [Tilletia controversa]
MLSKAAAALLCLVASTSAFSHPDPALERRQGLSAATSDPLGTIQVNSPVRPLPTCASADIEWQWTGDLSVSNTVAIYIQNLAEYSFSRRDIGGGGSAARSSRMHKVRRGPGGDTASSSLHMLHARAGSRLLAQDISVVDQNWVWPSVDVKPGLYRFYIVLQGTTQQATFGSTSAFSILPGSDTTCLGGNPAETTTTADPTWALAPVASSTTSSPTVVSTPSQSAAVSSTPSVAATTTTASTPVVAPATTSNGSTANSTLSGNSSSSQPASGLHGPIIAAVIILPLLAVVALAMGAVHILRKRQEESSSPYIRSVPSSDALAGSGAGGAGAWAGRFLTRSASRGMDTDVAEVHAEKREDNRDSVASDVYGGMGQVEHQRTPSHDSMGLGRPSMAEVCLDDSPYLHCQSVSPGPTMSASGRPSMASLRSMPMSSPMPLIIEDRPTGRSYDLSRGTAATTPQAVFSPTESEQAFSTGGWTQYANVGTVDVEGAHALSKDEVDVIGSTPSFASQQQQPPLTRALPIPTHLETIPGSKGSKGTETEGTADQLPQTLLTELNSEPSPEMPYPDTPRPYDTMRHVDEGASHPPRSASSMASRNIGGGSGAYATVQRSASNGSTFSVRRKPVPTTPLTDSATATNGPFSDVNAISSSPTSSSTEFPSPAAGAQRPRTPKKDEFPETPNPAADEEEQEESIAAPNADADADADEIMGKKQYQLSVDLSMDPLRFSGF